MVNLTERGDCAQNNDESPTIKKSRHFNHTTQDKGVVVSACEEIKLWTWI
jgi:hypothetical protein